MLRLLCCPCCMPCVLFRCLANGLRERLPELLPLALGYGALLCLIHRAAAVLCLIRPSPVGPCRAILGLQQVALVMSDAPLQALHTAVTTIQLPLQ